MLETVVCRVKGFTSEAPTMTVEPTLYDWAGGRPALITMTHRFYDHYVPNDPLLAPIFAGMDSRHPEHVAAWLGEVFGGPKKYTNEHGGYDHMVAQHLGRGLTEVQRQRWASQMCLAADDVGLPTDAEFRSAFVSYIEWGSRLAVENSQPGASPPMHLPVPRWNWGTAGPPGMRSTAHPAQSDEEPASDPESTLPGPDDAVQFEAHIRPLFRPMDRQSMKWAFDLWSYEDVSTHAAAILARVEAGTMPCDTTWPTAQVELFAKWVADGAPE